MQQNGSRVAAVIVAAGSGSRAGGVPKQWRSLAGRPVVRWSAEVFAAFGAFPIVVVVRPEDEALAASLLGDLPGVRMTAGAATRTGSVRAGLALLADAEADIVMVHDAARPFLKRDVLEGLVAALDDADAVAPALAVADTLKRVAADGVVGSTEPREQLRRVQTPQAFRREGLLQAYAALTEHDAPTDDLAVLERTGARVRLTAGDPELFKLTYPEDFHMAERLAGSARITRTGLGLDAHRFEPGDGVWLCGIKLPSDLALVGHSDADAGLHAVTDAVLGAIGEGDIGEHFPPTDPKWRGAASDQFLLHAVDLVRRRGGRLINVDVTLVCERPKVKPHREAMRTRLAEILGLPTDRVSVKATTMERMGFTGREEGLAAQAVVTVETPA